VAGPLPPYVPAAYQQWVLQAAAGTGLPANVVAAQIEMESGFNPRATSPVGAQGIAQFMPGTWKAVGGQGSAYNASAALPAYITLMRQLLTQFHGNVSQALAAYNAGPGNLKAGAGYARTILNNAGVPQSSVAGSTGTTAATAAGASGTTAAGASPGTAGAAAGTTAGAAGGGNTAVDAIATSVEAAMDAMIPGIPLGTWFGGIIRSADNMWTDMISPMLSIVPAVLLFLTNALKMMEWVINPMNWVRVIAGIVGTVLLILGIRQVTAAA
jgi:hypothetical protein